MTESFKAAPPLDALMGSEVKGAAVVRIERDGEIDVVIADVANAFETVVVEIVILHNGEEGILALDHDETRKCWRISSSSAGEGFSGTNARRSL